MGRALLAEYVKYEPKYLEFITIDPNQPSQYTVISDAADTEVYTMERTKIYLIKPDLLVILKNLLF
jgi:hypothetical protein